MNMNDYHARKSSSLLTLLSKVVNLKQEYEANYWSQQAVDALINKFKTKDGTIDDRLDLLAKVLLDPSSPSPCITIESSFDKCIKICPKREHSHVVYCRLWRFADLQNYHELEEFSHCEYPFSFSKDLIHVCINPYHYYRKRLQVLPLIVIPRMNNKNMDLPQRIYHDRLSSWCTITYYEYDKNVGEDFCASSSKIFVDGYPSTLEKITNRFSLGSLENVPRDTVLVDVRAQIQQGIELIEYCNGDVSIKNLRCSCSVYVRSILYNRLNGLNDSTVYHLPPHQSIDSIFNASIFTRFVNNPLATYESIFELTKLCTIQVSFSNSWSTGFAYHNMRTSPCWLAILLNEPYRHINIRLQQLQPQEATTSSR